MMFNFLIGSSKIGQNRKMLMGKNFLEFFLTNRAFFSYSRSEQFLKKDTTYLCTLRCLIFSSEQFFMVQSRARRMRIKNKYLLGKFGCQISIWSFVFIFLATREKKITNLKKICFTARIEICLAQPFHFSFGAYFWEIAGILDFLPVFKLFFHG